MLCSYAPAAAESTATTVPVTSQLASSGVVWQLHATAWVATGKVPFGHGATFDVPWTSIYAMTVDM